MLQTKLTVNTPGDGFEEEADRAAEEVMGDCACGGTCPRCRAQTTASVQMKTSGGAPAPSIAPPIVHRALRSPSQPAAPATRAFMESRFARDFSRIRIHTGSEASASAAAISAKAYTSGNDIVFGAGQYRPETQEGRRLLAHELAHVIQQNDAGVASVQRSPYDPWAARKSIVKIVAFAKRTGDAMAYVSTTDPPSVEDSQNHATESVRVLQNELGAGKYTLTQTENGDYEGAPGVFTWMNPWADPETGPQTHLLIYNWTPKVEVTVLDQYALSVTGLMAFDPHACGGQKCFSEEDIPEIRQMDQRKTAEAEEEKKRQEEAADKLYADLIALRSTILEHHSLMNHQIQDMFSNRMDTRAWGIMKRYGCSWPSTEAHQEEFKDCLVNAINQFDDDVRRPGSGPWMRALTSADIKALQEQQEKHEMLKSMAQGIESSVASPLGAIMGGVTGWFTDDEKKKAGAAGLGEATEGVLQSGAPMVESWGNRRGGGGGAAPDVDPITEMKKPEPPMPTPDPIEAATGTSGAGAKDTRGAGTAAQVPNEPAPPPVTNSTTTPGATGGTPPTNLPQTPTVTGGTPPTPNPPLTPAPTGGTPSTDVHPGDPNLVRLKPGVYKRSGGSGVRQEPDPPPSSQPMRRPKGGGLRTGGSSSSETWTPFSQTPRSPEVTVLPRSSEPLPPEYSSVTPPKVDVRDQFHFETTRSGGKTYQRGSGRLGKPGEVVTHSDSAAHTAVSRGTGDDASHLLGKQFGAPDSVANLSRGNWITNRVGNFHTLEADWAALRRRGVEIDVEVTDVTRDGEVRPYRRNVKWTETRPDGSQQSFELDFANTTTQESRAAGGQGSSPPNQPGKVLPFRRPDEE
jgi:hypothetical protein